MQRRIVLFLGIILAGLMAFGNVSAHASLISSTPSSNTVLEASPPEIRLWFTEPLERDFSRIFLRDRDGNVLQTPESIVDAADPYQMYLIPGELPDGLYTVVWRVVSAADGHPTQGSFAFIVGESAGGFGNTGLEVETIPVNNSLIRWFNLISLSMAVGGLSFWMFVWNPAVTEPQPSVTRRMWLLIWLGWLLVGISGMMLMLMQYALATGNPIFTDINVRYLEQLIADTRFGHLWLSRMALWVGLGLSLFFARTDRWFFSVSLALGFALLLTNSLFSHANAARDTAISVGADWLHLIATALWVGGLMQFFNVIGPARRIYQPSTAVIGRLVGYFTNFARVSVAVLIVTGLYAAWLQVGSVEALLTTQYGQATLIKLLLIVPLIGIAGVNLLVTSRALAEGQEVWSGRLRGLVGAEIALTFGILGAVGVMTSISPARVTMDARAALPQPPLPMPITETLSTDDLTVQLEISPGWVGENTFTLTLTDGSGAPVTDATLIRMRFESQAQNLGESELRPEHQGGGVYTITGANLSVSGDWRIRTTVQRPGKFDALVDFRPDMPLAPLPTPPPPIDLNAPLPGRTLILLAAGVIALLIGGFFLGENRLRPPRASSLLAVGLLAIGAGFLFTGVMAMTPTAAASAYRPAANAPVRLGVTSNTQIPYPYLVTEGGDVLQPTSDATWVKLPLDAHARDIYVDVKGTVWASTDQGFYTYQDGAWEQVASVPVTRTVLTHGYYFSLAQGEMTRVSAGGTDLEKPRQLDVPLPQQPASELVMLGNHSHVLQNGDQVFQTIDLGLSWQDLDAPEGVTSIAIDPAGELLALTAKGIYRWRYADREWTTAMSLPGGDPNAILRVFNDQLFAVANGRLYRQFQNLWASIDLPESDGAYITALEFQYPKTLWALDSKGSRLWSSFDGENWTQTAVVTG